METEQTSFAMNKIKLQFYIFVIQILFMIVNEAFTRIVIWVNFIQKQKPYWNLCLWDKFGNAYKYLYSSACLLRTDCLSLFLYKLDIVYSPSYREKLEKFINEHEM